MYLASQFSPAKIDADYLRQSYYNEGGGYQIISNASSSPYPPVMPGVPSYRHPFQPWAQGQVQAPVQMPEKIIKFTEQISYPML